MLTLHPCVMYDAKANKMLQFTSLHQPQRLGWGKGSANIWEILQVFLPTYLLQNCTINKHRMRNINLNFLRYLNTLECNFCVEKSSDKSFKWNRKKPCVCPTNYFVFFLSVGTAGIILQAPTLYDTRPAIDQQISEIETPFRKKFAKGWIQ